MNCGKQFLHFVCFFLSAFGSVPLLNNKIHTWRLYSRLIGGSVLSPPSPPLRCTGCCDHLPRRSASCSKRVATSCDPHHFAGCLQSPLRSLLFTMTAVSWFKSEFLTLRRLIFNILFYGSHFGLFAYGWYSQETNKRLDGLNSLKYSVWISRGAGLALAYDGGLIMLPMLRNIIRALRPKFTWLMAMDENIWL